MVAGAGLVSALAFEPVVRWRVALYARRHHWIVRVAVVRPASAGVRLLGVTIASDDLPGVSLAACDATVRLGWRLEVASADVSNCVLKATGTAEALREEYDRWRSSRDAARAGRSSSPALRLEQWTVSWASPDGGDAVNADGLDGDVEPSETRIRVGHTVVRRGRASLAVYGLNAALTPARRIRSVSVARAALEWGAPYEESPAAAAASRAPTPPTSPVAATGLPAIAAPLGSPLARAQGQRTPFGPAPASAQDAAMPMLPSRGSASLLPVPAGTDLGEGGGPRALAAGFLRAVGAASAAAGRVATAALDDAGAITVAALTLTMTPKRDQVAFGIGPGRLSATNRDSAFDVQFSTEPGGAGTPLSVHATLPGDAGDAIVSMEGGPIGLSQLGIQEGAAGLVDVDRAAVAGRARLVLTRDGSALTFDVAGATSGLSLADERIAPEVLRGMALQLRARGVLTRPGDLRIDELVAGLGSLQLSTSGVISDDGEPSGALRFQVPTVECQALLDSFPAALVPTLQGTAVTGTFALTGELRFDARHLDDLELRSDVRNECRITSLPAAIDPDQFRRSFVHRIYLPDGTIGEHVTGPGEPNWTPLGDISPYMQVAVLTTEDGAFLHHHGFSAASIRSSLVANLKAHKFIRGASTITMQLAKNLFLGREKTLSRKLEEVILAQMLEDRLSKDEIMELYLNVIEFGPAVYGIGAAADYYFGRSPSELNLAECMFLSSLLPSPIRYGAMRERDSVPDHWMRFLRALMESAHRRGLVTSEELAEGETEPVEFWHDGERPPRRPAVRAAPRFEPEVDDPSLGPSEPPSEP